jgi:hypothetical protein
MTDTDTTALHAGYWFDVTADMPRDEARAIYERAYGAPPALTIRAAGRWWCGPTPEERHDRPA